MVCYRRGCFQYVVIKAIQLHQKRVSLRRVLGQLAEGPSTGPVGLRGSDAHCWFLSLVLRAFIQRLRHKSKPKPRERDKYTPPYIPGSDGSGHRVYHQGYEVMLPRVRVKLRRPPNVDIQTPDSLGQRGLFRCTSLRRCVEVCHLRLDGVVPAGRDR